MSRTQRNVNALATLLLMLGIPSMQAVTQPARPLSVVLVHGYCSDPASSFGNLAPLLTADGLLVHSYDYSALTEIGNGQDFSIEQIAGRFATYVHSVMAQDGVSQVQVVTHSMGGLIARAWMAGLAQPAQAYNGEVYSLADISTPSYGELLKSTQPGCSPTQAGEMYFGNSFLLRLHYGWETLQAGPGSLPVTNLLIIAGTHGTGTAECYVSPSSPLYSDAISCNDGVVDVVSAALPQLSIASSVRFVPYQHCDVGASCIALVGTQPGESDVKTPDHKTFVALLPWLTTGQVVAQCCGPDTIDYTPSFLQNTNEQEGLLVLRLAASAPSRNISAAAASIAFVPSLPVKSNLIANGSTLTFLRIPAPGTYRITINIPGYKTAAVIITVLFNIPVVAPTVFLQPS